VARAPRNGRLASGQKPVAPAGVEPARADPVWGFDSSRWALRALASAWRGWCSVQYILDPLALMSNDPRYLLDVLAWQDEDAGTAWRLLVLEDAGELIVHDAGRTGALAALLNITDGILGQGTGTLVLVTTNEPVAHLHAAVRRRGRCLADEEIVPAARTFGFGRSRTS
jgi:hypothetical protein